MGDASTVLQGGRRKAFRPLPADDRRAALAAGIEAYERGDFFLAHELLEPAWMGADDVAERELLQGLIKLAAAYVHATRGNPLGVQKNLRGSRMRLASAADAGVDPRGLDLAALLRDVDARLAALEASPSSFSVPPPRLLRRSAS